ncbi:hypothetical protein SAMN02910456_01609 [Ruminococcaceae bacterium YRB3002]|nr:hypothetical protein SAMN02910456_01609 [Ruminococcaceae bacterium YRB3002]
MQIDDIAAHELKDGFDVVFDGEYTATISVMTYIYNALANGNAKVNSLNVLKAIYAYSNAVDAL